MKYNNNNNYKLMDFLFVFIDLSQYCRLYTLFSVEQFDNTPTKKGNNVK